MAEPSRPEGCTCHLLNRHHHQQQQQPLDDATSCHKEDVRKQTRNIPNTPKSHTTQSTNDDDAASTTSSRALEASFVHLTAPPPSHPYTHASGGVMGSSPSKRGGRQEHAGFLDAVRHATALVKLGSGTNGAVDVNVEDGCTHEEEDGGASMALCQNCLLRITKAMEANTERIMGEIQAYEDVVLSERQRYNLRLPTDGYNDEHAEAGADRDLDSLAQVYKMNLATISNEINLRKTSLQTTLLPALALEQERSQALQRRREQLMEQWTQLEYQSDVVFRGELGRHLKEFLNVEEEQRELQQIDVCSGLFQVVVGTRGVHSTVNGLRMAHKMCKSRHGVDLGWEEMNAAWSQAAQLLLFVGGAVNFSSTNVRIVPLTTPCAKLMHMVQGQKKMYNLGVENMASSSMNENKNICPALRPFYTLLCQLMRHLELNNAADAKNHGVEESDGLPETDEDDDAWVEAVHGIAKKMDLLVGSLRNQVVSQLPNLVAVPPLE